MVSALYSPLVRCDECGKDAENEAAGWLAIRVHLPDDPDSPEVVIFCPACYAREFASSRDR
jgi:hypothetical protein